MKTSVFRRITFNAAHRLHNPRWDDAKNKAIFGLCNNPNYHGHNYTLIVKVTGVIDPETGYVMDLKILNDLVKKHITDPFDHSNLNLDIPEFKNLNPTAENIAMVIYDKLRSAISPAYDLQIRLCETDNNFVEYPA
ncbi:MAG: 6-pyruvoyl trahydropterin synthase family protein [Chitinophagales bacterium]